MGSYCLMGTESLFFKMRRVLEMDLMIAQQRECT